jgi:integrase
MGMIAERFDGKLSGKVSVDVELTVLSCVLSWAVASEFIEYNFIGTQRPRQVRGSEVRHCRDLAPESGDELHQLAMELFSKPDSEVFGWQLFMEAFTGCRTSEVLALRMDARPSQPGFVDGEYLWLKRLKRGVNPYAMIHPALREMIEAHHEWHRTRFPDGSPWWFPGQSIGLPPDAGSLTRTMQRAAQNLGLPPRISHGLRSFYVTVRRSQGASDAQIAAEIGITSVKLIRETYGDIPPTGKDVPVWHGDPPRVPPHGPAGCRRRMSWSSNRRLRRTRPRTTFSSFRSPVIVHSQSPLWQTGAV